jgi:hypothetical protein
MPKEEWGVKRVCPTTGKRFYDLNKTPVVSPYTGEVVDIDAARRKGPGLETRPAAKVKKDEVVADDHDVEDDILVDDDDTDIEDDLLEDDDDDSVSLDDIADVSAGEDEN